MEQKNWNRNKTENGNIHWNKTEKYKRRLIQTWKVVRNYYQTDKN